MGGSSPFKMKEWRWFVYPLKYVVWIRWTSCKRDHQGLGFWPVRRELWIKESKWEKSKTVSGSLPNFILKKEM